MKSKKSAQFLQLERELKPYLSIMEKAADTIMNKEISKYPILVVHQQEIELGIPVVSKEQSKGNWSIHASTLEEFATKQVIAADKIEDFQGIFKDPNQEICLFAISELGAKFIFMPRASKPS